MMKKSALSMLLMLCMILSLIPTATLAAEPVKVEQEALVDGISLADEGSDNPTVLGDDSVTYPVTGGNLYFDKATGSIIACDTTVTEVEIPESIEGVTVTSIGENAFSSCHSLNSVMISDNVTSIGQRAFGDCSSLTSVTIPNGVTSIGPGAFMVCSSLTSVAIPNSVTNIGQEAFLGCDSLTSVTIPESVTSIGSGPFAGCRNLLNINVSTANSYYCSVDGVLFDRGMSTLIQFPASKANEYTIPDGVIFIGENAFYGCENLASVTIPNSVTRIEAFAFFSCNSLPNVTIPNSITHIEAYAFGGCSSLSSVTIPDSVISIGEVAFAFCDSLTSVIFQGDAPQVYSAENTLPSFSANVTLYYTPGKTGWTTPLWNGYRTLPNVEWAGNPYFENPNINLEKGEAIQLQVKGIPSGSTITWSSSNPEVVSLGENGEITAREFGAAAVRASVTADGVTKTADCIVTVPGVVFEQQQVWLNKGSNFTPVYTAYPNGAQIIWTSSNTNIASVDRNTGEVTAVGSGTTKICGAVTVVGSNGMTITELCTYDVSIYDAYLEQTELTLEGVGGKAYLNLCVNTLPAGFEVETQSSDAQVATVNGMEITALKIGSAEITVNVMLGEVKIGSYTCKVTVPGLSLNKSSLTLHKNKSETLKATVVPAGAAVTWSSSDTKVAAVDSNGKVTAINTGTAIITAATTVTLPAGDALFSQICKVEVKGVSLTDYKWTNRTYAGVSVKFLSQNVADNDRRAFVEEIIGYSLSGAPEDKQKQISDRIYNLMFTATYRPQIFGGKNSEIQKYPRQNYDYGQGNIRDIFDKGLNFTATVSKTGVCGGCLAYARASSYYVYRQVRTSILTHNSDFTSATTLRNYMQTYLDPGESLWYNYRQNKPHGILYLGEDEQHKGFYFISYGGGLSQSGSSRDDSIEIGYTTYSSFYNALKAYPNGEFYIYDHNKTQYANKAKKVSGKVDCPVEVILKVNGEILSSKGITGTVANDWVSLTADGVENNRTVQFETLTKYENFDIEIVGTASGTMTIMLEFTYENGETETRTFQNVPITSGISGTISAISPEGTIVLDMWENNRPISVWEVNSNGITTLPMSGLPYNPSESEIAIPGASGSSEDSEGIYVYLILISPCTHGNVQYAPNRASKGDTVTITTTPDEGYELERLTVTDGNGNEIKLTNKGNGTFTFTMPASQVEVTATFRTVAEPLPFTDIPAGAWYEEAARYVYEHDLMTGTSAATFSPDVTTTRGMIVTILWRIAGSPATSETAIFPDVVMDSYYTDAVAWASATGIVNGYDNGLFGPDDPITREQMAAILYRYAQYSGCDMTARADLSSYMDTVQITSYAVEALAWANETGLIVGTSTTTLTPDGSATRAQVATIVMRFMQNIAN